MAQQTFDALIIGEGVSGLAAANALARSGLKTATFEAQLFGGLVLNVNELDPAPEGRTVGGAEYASELMQSNSELGVASLQEAVTSITTGGELIRVATNTESYDARSVIIASGASLKKLGVPGEAEFEGRGVSQCADCDGPMFQNEEVVVVGGGDSALQEALVLAKYCNRVHLVCRGTRFRASQHFVERVGAEPRIATIWGAQVEAILGNKTVEKVRIRRDGASEEIACAGVFAYVGLIPNTAFLPAAVARDASGFVQTDSSLETSVPGIWAIGAARSGFPGLLSDALEDARRVAAAIRGRHA